MCIRDSQLKLHMNSIPGLHTMLAFHLDHNQNEKALALLDNWLKSHPNDLNTLKDKGQLLSRLKQYDEAVAVYESAIEQANSLEETNLISLIADAFTKKGDFESAMKHIDRAINRTGTDNFKFQKANIYMKMNQHENAISIFTELIDNSCLLYTSPSPRDKRQSRMPSSA